MAEKVEFENDRVRVLRVTHAGRERHAALRRDRLIIYLNDGHVARIEKGEKEEVRRVAGDVVWKNGSEQQIENLSDTSHQVIIVELKH